MTGLEFIAKANRINPNLTTLLCTGYGEDLSEESLLHTNIFRVLYKPVLQATLTKAIFDALDA